MSDVNNALLEVRKKALSQQVEKPAEVPVEEQKDKVPPTEVQGKPEAQVESKEQPKEEVKTAKEETAVEANLNWDADEVEAKKEEPKIDFNYAELGSALELGEVKTKDEFIAKTSELKSKLKEYEENAYAGIPDDFKEVIKATKSGVDWKDYLSNQLIDYTKVDPIQLFEDEFLQDALKNPKYLTDGKFDQARAEADLDAIPESLRGYQGKLIAQGMMQEQKQRQQQLRQQAEAKLVAAEKSLGAATKNLNELLPFENYGIKFEPKHSSEIYQGITDSRLTKKYLGVDYESLVRSGANMKEVAATIAMRQYGEKMIKFKASNEAVKTKKEILASTQNAQINSPGSRVNPEDAEKKIVTPKEKLEKFYASQKKGL